MPERTGSNGKGAFFHPVLFRFWGLLSFYIGASIIPAAGLALYDASPDWRGLAGISAIAMLSGIALTPKIEVSGDLRPRDSYLMVIGAWCLAILWSAAVYLACGVLHSPAAAVFESTSGFTTTGSTVIADVEILSRGVLLWRSTTQWLGGMGIIVLTVAILPALGIGGLQLMSAEVPGLEVERLRPRLATTARLLWSVYVLITGIQILFLWRVGYGMSLLDAVNHSMASMATGGFSTKNTSFINYAPIDQWITAFFMFLAGCNFTLHYRALVGKPLAHLRDEEFRFYSILVGIFSALIAMVLLLKGYDVEPALRHAAFQVVSLVTTTGFVSDDYDAWGSFALVLVWIMLFAGGSSGSTAGGLKQVRLLCLGKAGIREIKQLAHPRAVLLIKLNGRTLSIDALIGVMGFAAMFTVIYLCGAILLAACGLDFMTALGSAASSISNVGPGLGSLGATENYASSGAVVQIISSLLMLIGRLELMTVLVMLVLFARRGQ